ncbi:TetR family transcriptional regulator protein (plasmid) [Rhizobium etli 8C-3]|uniref:TetR family transcriptional regulator n=3 Tax=Rhizobium TaxID=379 RepID=A0A4R3R329_9HYPH|nr:MULTISPECIES: TetR/AcrR family transcriptional regulator [Rhizobium]APO79009.1 TetR family transcriptional regulator protein [Rhizobium etli 8C-3]TCU28981.1 TetR family transcriptional regulator [Rhizobium azibense]TCU33760.1 TetR family transcriptional regulator [Rhizobium azibense]
MKVMRETIVSTARELFRSRGYAGASMNDLADAVGLKKSSLYVRFPNKEALVPAVLDLTLQETFGQKDLGSRQWDAEFVEVIELIATTLTDRGRCVGLHLAYGTSDETPIAKDAVRAFFQAHRDYLSSILSRAMPVDVARDIATDTLARLEGATAFVAIFGEKDAMKRAVRLSIAEAQKAAAANSLSSPS